MNAALRPIGTVLASPYIELTQGAKSMIHNTTPHTDTINRILVVMGTTLLPPEESAHSPLLAHAAMLAQANGCELELFHLCSDASLKKRILDSDQALDAERQKIADISATHLAEIAIQIKLKDKRIEVTQDVRWDQPRTDAIMRKIDQSEPDLVMKESEDKGYIMGMVRNTDWELMRSSPVPVWFDKDGSDADIPAQSSKAKQGVPAFDIEHAITTPEKTFESPMEVANSEELSVALRKRILQAWQMDIQAQMVAVDEGGPVTKIDISSLKEISAAREQLNKLHESHQIDATDLAS